MEWPTYLQHRLYHQSVLLLTPHHLGHNPGNTRVCHLTQSTWPTRWWSQPTLPMHMGCPRFCHYNGVHPQECSPRIPHSQGPLQSPTSSYTQPSAHYLTSPPTQPPKFSNISTDSSLTLQKLPALHPFLPQPASITSSRWFLIRAHEADSTPQQLSL